MKRQWVVIGSNPYIRLTDVRRGNKAIGATSASQPKDLIRVHASRVV